MLDNPLVQVFGRMHPMLLHLPIGLLIGVALLAWLGRGRGKDWRAAQSGLAWLAALSAALSAATGFVLSYEPANSGPEVVWHMRLGFAFSGLAVALAVLLSLAPRLPRTLAAVLVPAFLLLTIGVMIPTGHLGAGLTHGEDYLLQPLRGAQRASTAPLPGAAESDYTRIVAPLLAAHCTDCHGESRQKGRLALHTPEAIRSGGRSGAAIVAGDIAAGELIRRITLPADDDDHMPPISRPPLAPAEVEALLAWVRSGAPGLDGPNADSAATQPAGSPTPESADAPSETGTPNRDAIAALPAPDARAIDALRSALVHVQPVAADSPLLWVDFAATANRLTAEQIAELLQPISAHVADLSLARCPVDDGLIAQIATMANLRRLDLRGTSVTSSAVARLTGCRRIEELVLARTKLGDEVGAALAGMPQLKRVYLWDCGVTPEAIAALRQARSDLLVDAGDAQPAASRDAERDLRFTGDAPVPGADAPAAPAAVNALRPVNTVCPVSGSPVDPKFVIVFEQRAIGFCCPNCPSKFWAAPDSFRGKLP